MLPDREGWIAMTIAERIDALPCWAFLWYHRDLYDINEYCYPPRRGYAYLVSSSGSRAELYRRSYGPDGQHSTYVGMVQFPPNERDSLSIAEGIAAHWASLTEEVN